MDKLYRSIELINLHPSQDLINTYTDIFCCQYISNFPLQFNRFDTIRFFQITDEKNVYMSAFLSFLEKYVKYKSHSKYLGEFYKFLKDSKLVSKTELIIIENLLSAG